MTLRTNVTGTYSSEDLDKLAWPTAWSGTVSAADRAAQERDLAALIAECREALRENPDAEAVEIVDGQIAYVVTD